MGMLERAAKHSARSDSIDEPEPRLSMRMTDTAFCWVVFRMMDALAMSYLCWIRYQTWNRNVLSPLVLPLRPAAKANFKGSDHVTDGEKVMDVADVAGWLDPCTVVLLYVQR